MAPLPAAQIKKLFAKARASQSRGELDAAVKLFERILKASPNLAEVHFNLGEIRARQRDPARASAHFEAALKARPDERAIWLAYLNMAARFPKKDNLRRLLSRVGARLDGTADIHFLRGIAEAGSDPAAAADLFRTAMAEGHPAPDVPTELGAVLEQLGEADAALEAFDQALAIKSDYYPALVRKADLLRNTGALDAALETARQAIAVNPRIGHPYNTYSSIRKMRADDPVIGQMKSAFAKLSAQSPERIPFGHALAKAMEDTGHYDKMFRYLDAACATARKAHPYDVAPDRALATVIRDLFKAHEFNGIAANATARPAPIFVTGLPRSGTTLVEQILASHSAVVGGGELGLLSREMLDRLQALADQDAGTTAITEYLTGAGKGYRETLRERFAGAAHVTDKSISTYVAMGFVQVALPDAKFIVVRRDPRDNALSIYKNRFAPGVQRYSNSLADIARFMRNFENQLAFWRDQMPGQILEVRYEDVVADLETQARQIVAHAGLPWEEACLDFHKNTRKVDTLSSAQVRQPIYSSSVEAWRRYEAELAPFIETYLAEGGTL